MKIIFLDVDGVLNNIFTGYDDQCLTPTGFRGIEDIFVERLKKIIDKTDAIIVLTSDWKEQWEPRQDDCMPDGLYLIEKLAKQGLVIKTKTSDHSRGRAKIGRGQGIHDYLDKNKTVEEWVVLDDNWFYDFDDEIQRHFVHTDETNGLTDYDVECAIEILNGRY